MSSQQPGWLPDPTGRHEQRYWDGRAWTEHVSDRGVRGVDPLAPAAPQPVSGSGPPGAVGPPARPPSRGGGPAALLVVLAVVLLAAGGGAAYVVTQGDEDDGDRQEYVDALAVALVAEEDALPYSDAEAECLADAQIDIVGLEEIRDHVTPEEIRENPEDGLADHGIEPSPDQGREMLAAMKRCIDDLGGAFARIFTTDMPGVDVEAVGDCLAEGLDTSEIEDMLATVMTRGGDSDPTEDEAAVMYDWADGCIDFHTLMVDAIASEMDDPEAAADCISAGLPEDLLRDLMIATFSGDEDAEAEFDETVGPLVADCMSGGGG